MTPIHERSVLVGEVIVVNGYRVNRTSLKARFAEGGYQLHETKHFWLFTRPEEPKTILVHWFAPEEMTTNIPGYLAEELKAFGLVNNSHQLGEVFAGIVGGPMRSISRCAQNWTGWGERRPPGKCCYACCW